MLSKLALPLSTLFKIAVWLFVSKVVLGVWLEYPRYFPPDFTADFLLGREPTFTFGYAIAFYVHVIISPLTLLLGLGLMSAWFRTNWPRWHRWVGRIQVAFVCIGVVPSGLFMARQAATGVFAGSGLASLACLTAWCAWQGWQSARVRRFHQHAEWMTRMYLLLCSAVVLRMWGGVATILAWDNAWSYPLACWLSWLGPLLIYEWLSRQKFIRRR